MYQSIYVDKLNRQVHIWDDQEGHITVPLHQYNYGYIKDPRGLKKAIDGKSVRKIKLNRKVREEAREGNKRHLYYETDVPVILILKLKYFKDFLTGKIQLIKLQQLHGMKRLAINIVF